MMKTGLITIVLIYLFIGTYAQKAKVNDTTVYDAVDKEPVFAGGMPKFFKYLMKNIRADTFTKNTNVQSTLFMEFIVEKDGSLSNIHIIKDTSPSAAKSAIKALSESPKWTPGKLYGRPVRVRYKIKEIIEFQLKDQ